MLLNCGVGEDSWESLGLQGYQISQSWRKSTLNIHWKNWCFWTVVLEKTLESHLDFKDIQPVHPKEDQSWVFIGGPLSIKMRHLLFLPTWSLQNFETCSKYSYFHSNIVICIILIRIYSPCHRTQLDVLIRNVISPRLWLESHIWEKHA